MHPGKDRASKDKTLVSFFSAKNSQLFGSLLAVVFVFCAGAGLPARDNENLNLAISLQRNTSRHAGESRHPEQ